MIFNAIIAHRISQLLSCFLVWFEYNEEMVKKRVQLKLFIWYSVVVLSRDLDCQIVSNLIQEISNKTMRMLSSDFGNVESEMVMAINETT
jgi:hypothetical protein